MGVIGGGQASQAEAVEHSPSLLALAFGVRAEKAHHWIEAHQDDFFNLDREGKLLTLRQIGQMAGPFAAIGLGQIAVIDPDQAPMGNQAHQALEQGAFTRPIGAKQGHQAAVRHF